MSYKEIVVCDRCSHAEIDYSQRSGWTSVYIKDIHLTANAPNMSIDLCRLCSASLEKFLGEMGAKK